MKNEDLEDTSTPFSGLSAPFDWDERSESIEKERNKLKLQKPSVVYRSLSEA
jgi:hypothetical protein